MKPVFRSILFVLILSFTLTVTLPAFAQSPSDQPELSIRSADFSYAYSEMMKFMATGFPNEAEDAFPHYVEPSSGYLIIYNDGLRTIIDLKDYTINKLSVIQGDDSATIRLISALCVLEGELYEKTYITNSDKHKALATAQDVMNGILYLNPGGMSVVMSDLDGNTTELAAHGKKLDYYWEQIDGGLYISVQLLPLPEGIK